MVGNEWARGVRLEKCQIEDVIACKLDRTFFGLECDIFLVNSYIKPSNTSNKNSYVTGFDTLRDGNGKSVSEDMICNEILKWFSQTNLLLLSKVFNQCLDTGNCPWNNCIIAPLHKKGCRADPDNYREVAVSSTIGKLFSTIILNRNINFKNRDKPDPINQLGFSKGAQTYDHIY